MSAPRETLEDLQGVRREAGTVSAERFGWILGFDKAPRFRVRAVAWVEDHIEVTVDGPGNQKSVVLQMVPRTPDADGFARTEHLLVRYQGQSIDGLLGQLIPQAIRARIANVSIGQLAMMLAEDPHFRPGPSEPAGGRSPGAPEGAERPVAVELPASAGQNEGAAQKLRGTRRAGGIASIDCFGRLLGLEDAPEPFRIDSIAWVEDRVEISVEAQGERTINFSLREREPDQGYFVSTARLGLQYRAKHLPEEISGLVRARAPERLGDLTLDDLAAFLLEDPELGKPGLAVPSSENQHPANQLDTWGASDSFADFFAGGEMARGQLDSINMGKFFRNVQHCDNECLLVNPHGAAEPVSMVDFPWEKRHRDAGASRHEVEEFGPSMEEWSEDDSMVATDLTEQDVILGNPQKLRDVLDYVTALPNPNRKPVFVANTCVPTVTGEDVESVVKQYRKKSDVPLLYLTVSPQSMNDVFLDLLVEQRLQAEARSGPPNPRAINLIGFADSRAVRELCDMLGRFEIEVNTLLLPDLELDRVARLPQAALNVFFPNSLWEHLYSQLRVDTRIPAITPPAPYGRQGTRRWVAEVAGELAIQLDFEARWDEYFEEYSQAWSDATTKASQQRLGLIVRGEEIHYLVDPSQTWGIPVLEMAQEAGFGLDVLLHGVDPPAGLRVTDQVRRILTDSEHHAVQAFDTFETLRRELSAAPCQAVLSHHVFDWRVSEAGKNRFTLQHFEMGVPGALRTMERLVKICDMRFYHRYRRYLARTREGLRTRPQESPS